MTGVDQDNTTTKASVQESQSTLPDGSWVSKRVQTTTVTIVDVSPVESPVGDDIDTAEIVEPVMADIPEPKVTQQVIEGDVQTRSDVQEQEKVLDDGTTVQTKVTITEHYRTVTVRTTTDGVESDEVSETLVGQEIEEEVVELAPGVTDLDQDNTTTKASVQESQSTLPDGSWVSKRVQTTTVTIVDVSPVESPVGDDIDTAEIVEPVMADIPEPKVTQQVIEGDVQTKSDVQEQEKVLDDGTTVQTKVTITEHYRTVTVRTTTDGVESDEVSETLVGQEIEEEVVELAPGVTDVDQDNTTTKASVQESQSTLPDGSWVSKRVQTTTVTIVDVSPVESPVSDDIDTAEIVEPVIADIPEPKVTQQVIEGDVQTRSDVQEQEKVLDDGTTVQTKVTITEHYRTVTVRTTTDGVESDEVSEALVGQEIEEEVVELAPGVTGVDQDNTTTKASVQESQSTLPDGSWVSKRVQTTTVTIVDVSPVESPVGDDIDTAEIVEPVMADIPEPKVTQQVIEGDVQTKSDVQEQEKVLDDGTTVQTKVTITEHYRTVTVRTTTDGVESDEVSETLVGQEIEEEVVELAPGVTDVDQDNTTTKASVQESQSTLPDGSWVSKRVQTTTVTIVDVSPVESPVGDDIDTAEIVEPVMADIPEPKVTQQVIEGDVQTKSDVQEQEKVLDDGTTVQTKVTITEHYRTVTVRTTTDGVESDEVSETLVGQEIEEEVVELAPGVTDVDQDNTTTKASVQESQSTLPDGSWVSKRVQTTTVTIVDVSPVESPVSDDIDTAEIVEPVMADIPEPKVTQQVIEGDVQTRSDVQEQEKVLDDGTTVQTKVTITEHYRTVTVRTTTDGVESDEVSEALVGQEIEEEVVELAPGVAGVDQDNTTTKASVQESQSTLPDGSWVSKRVQTTTVTIVDVSPVESPVSDDIDTPKIVEPVMADIPEPKVTQQVIEGDVQTKSDVQEQEKVLDDGTTVQTKVTITEHYRTVTVRTTTDGVESDEVSETLVGQEIEEEVVELAPGVTGVDQDNTTTKASVQESQSTLPDGSWVSKRVQTTTVTIVDVSPVESPVGDDIDTAEIVEPVMADIPEPKVTQQVIEGDVQTKSDVQEQRRFWTTGQQCRLK